MDEAHSSTLGPFPVAMVVNEKEVVIAAGTDHGIENGFKFLLYRLGPVINDPISGEELGQLEIVVGQASAIHVQEKLATLRNSLTVQLPDKKQVFERRSSRGGAAVAFFDPLDRGVLREEITPGAVVTARFTKLPEVGDWAKIIG